MKLLAGAVILMVVAVAAYALWLAGSPVAQRSKNIDAQRVGDLQNISGSIDGYYAAKAKVPGSLDELKAADAGKFYVGRVTDPVTGVPYTYRATSGTSYQLCATFDLPSDQPAPGQTAPASYGYASPQWDHPAGDYCFSIDASLRLPRSACSLTNPCAAGQSCVTLGDGQGPVCVPAGKECLAAGCTSGKCAIAESYPAQVTCTK